MKRNRILRFLFYILFTVFFGANFVRMLTIKSVVRMEGF